MVELMKNERIQPYIMEIGERLEECNSQQNNLKQQIELLQGK